jgi:hypothetical protein
MFSVTLVDELDEELPNNEHPDAKKTRHSNAAVNLDFL